MWEVPAHTEKTVAFLKVAKQAPDVLSGFVNIKTNATPSNLLLPVEINVTAG